MPDLSRPAVLVAAVLLVSACAGDTGEAGTTPAAAEVVTGDVEGFAASARRALTGTRYDGLGDGWLVDLVAGACEAMAAGTAPDTVVDDAIAAVDIPGGDPVDEEILAEVLTAGTAQVCPDAVLYALSLDDPVAGYLALVGPAVDGSGFGGLVGDEAAVAAGLAGCRRLDEGDTVEQAAVAALVSLFGEDAARLAEPGEDVVGAEVLLATTVLVAASVYLCPEHRATVADYADRSRA